MPKEYKIGLIATPSIRTLIYSEKSNNSFIRKLIGLYFRISRVSMLSIKNEDETLTLVEKIWRAIEVVESGHTALISKVIEENEENRLFGNWIQSPGL